MNNKSQIIYIILFSLLYLSVGIVSTIHAVSFFGLANNTYLAVMLAIAFEIGQAAVLFDILTNPNDRKKFMPWALMIILTFVQILGNIYSSYQYLITNSIDYLRFFKEPIFVWTTIPDEMANVILTYIIGAILPIVSLSLSEMVSSRLNESMIETNNNNIQQTNQNNEENFDNEVKDDIIENNNTEDDVIEDNDVVDDEPKENEHQETKKDSKFINL